MKKSRSSWGGLMREVRKTPLLTRGTSAPDWSSELTVPLASSSRDLKWSAEDKRMAGEHSVSANLGVRFGKPSAQTTSQRGSNGEWKMFLKQAASNGIGSALSGTFGLGNFGGIGSIVSGITSLFHSQKKDPVPLVNFELPAPHTRTLYTGNSVSGVYEGDVQRPIGVVQQGDGIYSAPLNNHWIQNHDAEIAQAVKKALLNSSSLGDVIAEL